MLLLVKCCDIKKVGRPYSKVALCDLLDVCHPTKKKNYEENFLKSVQLAAPKYVVQKFLRFSEKIGGFKIFRFLSENFSELRFLLVGLSPDMSNNPYQWLPGMSKNPWICDAWRSMVMMWSVPATVNMLATSLALIGALTHNLVGKKTVTDLYRHQVYVIFELN